MAIHSPIEQFEIHNISPTLFHIGEHPVAFTNSTLFMLLAVILATSFLGLSMRKRAAVPGRWQMLAEKFYDGIAGTALDAAGEQSRPFFPFIFSIFFFICFCNLLGMMPGSFTVTSHFIVNFALAATVILTVLVTGFVKHGPGFFKIFVPHGLPWPMLPIIVPIEMISFFVRPFSLSIRLFANMLAGHILLKVFAGMSAGLGDAGWLAAVGVLPAVVNVAIVAFEFFVAFLQAYIFTILSAVYLHDALEMH